MGCAASRLEDEEAVKMCRDRRDLIKQALEQHNRFASSPWDFFWNPFSSLDSFTYPRPRSSYDNVVTDDELVRLQRQETKGFESKGIQCTEAPEPCKTVELEIKAHKKELMRNRVANAEETPGFTVYLNRKPASLVEAMKDIDCQFSGICDAARKISVMLEASRAQYSTSNDLSAKMLNPVALFAFCVIPSIDDLFDNETSSCYSEESCSTMSGSHHSTLDRLYTWEKKLYKEVKAGERLRIEYEKRLTHLRNQDVKGEEPTSVDKTCAALRSLHTDQQARRDQGFSFASPVAYHASLLEIK
ncbi:hypothetical protein Zm00014a_012377 [Zea mays]|uniref:DUF630 family protein n=1 Tax=Zea mays TaxID=4577 RepID=A0A3L6F1F6_MAIZE|nr:hypothetical protein Zm00014a_012376 [Zea mays]PWZ26132.1 hypothetical protein Zm00014a_012377 [Zea mays]